MKSLRTHLKEMKTTMPGITKTSTTSQISQVNSADCSASLEDVVIMATKKSKMKAPTWSAKVFSLETLLKSQKTRITMLNSKKKKCLTEMGIKNTMKTSMGSCSSSIRSFENTACLA